MPNADCEDISYNEDNSGDEILKNVAALAKHIQNYAAQFPDEEITLHVDLTGGMRDVIMIILDLTRLLEYSGLKIGTLAYSDLGKKEVEPKNNIYDLFQLIAGVEEFVNFGSVEALDKYYKGKILSEPLRKLINAMKNFAEAIKLCHYWQFKETIVELHDSVKDFKPAPDDVQDLLMERLIEKIHEDYRDLIVTREILNDWEVIRWCLKKGYLQQALILYTERIPEYLGEKNFIGQSKEAAQKLEFVIDKDTWGRNRFYYLLNVYTTDDPKDQCFKTYCNAVKSEAVMSIRNDEFNFDNWFKELNAELEPRKITVKDEARLRAQLTTLEKIYRNPELLSDLSATELEPINKIIAACPPNIKKPETRAKERAKIIFDFINLLPNKRFKKFFPDIIFAKDICDKYPHASRIYKLLFNDVCYPNIPEDKFFTIMENYFKIQKERNQSVHARPDAGEFKSADELRDFMNVALDEIKENMPAQ